MTHITQHFTHKETVNTSYKSIDNTPKDPAILDRILNTATNMEVVRAVLGRKPIHINSWFRSKELNKAVGGAANSEHSVGAAVDFTCPQHGTPFEVCKSLAAYPQILNYNQLIYEQTWIHISFPPPGVKGKLEVLTMKNGKYTKGLIR